MISAPVELVNILSPLVGAGLVLFFMRRDRVALDRLFSDLKGEVSARLDRIEINQQRFDLALKDRVTWEHYRALDERVDEVAKDVAVIKEKCRIHEQHGGKS